MVTVPQHLQNDFADAFEICTGCGHPFEPETLNVQGRCVTCTDPTGDRGESEDEKRWQTFTGPDALKNALKAWCEANDFPVPPAGL